MSIIKAHQSVITQINVFTCEATNQQQLIDVLIESARSVCYMPSWFGQHSSQPGWNPRGELRAKRKLRGVSTNRR